MSFRPNGNRVLIDLDEVTTTEGGLYIPQTATEGLKKGTVVSTGPSYVVGSLMVESPFKPGDRVLVDGLGAQRVKVDNKELLMCRNEDVIGKFEE
jgi:co-chaperonin GroES (HSP10)